MKCATGTGLPLDEIYVASPVFLPMMVTTPSEQTFGSLQLIPGLERPVEMEVKSL